MRWEVPDIHIVAATWLENRGNLAVFRCFRGFGKSTLLAIHNAWLYYENPQFRILHQSEADGTAYKTSRDTQNVIRNHPLTKGMLPPGKGTVEQWWVIGATDHRNASMYAKGILSNVTSARAEECQNDDVEVPRNIQTPEAREKLRYRLGEQTHILVPGGRQLYIGTPHTHDSLYDEMESMGADCLTLKLFEHEHRIETATEDRYEIPFKPEFVFAGIGRSTKVLREGVDYFVEEGNRVWFSHPPGCLIDFYAGNAWPERFTPDEMTVRRTKCRTVNEWDSQYQLHSKPVGEVRLDPEKLRPYDVQPVVERANREMRMMLGAARIVSARAYWDCATGKAGGDDSAVSLILDDAAGNYYWHVAQAMLGEFAVFAQDNARIESGQVMQICDLIERYSVPQIYVETNGVGSFAPQLLRKAISQRRLRCGVLERTSTINKNEKILGGLEGPLRSGILWAHVDVLDGPVWDQMKQFNPLIKTQPDDFIDSGASAILETPVRIGKLVGNSTGDSSHDWRPSTGVHEVTLEM